MDSDQRLKRPHLDRTQPIRSWSTLFRVSDTNPSRDDDPNARVAPKGAGAGLDDVVTRSVDLGYRLVDEYIRQGERAARRIGERPYSAQTFTSDLQDVSVRMAQYASEFVRLWVEMIQLATPGAVAGAGVATNGEAPGPARAATPPASGPHDEDRVPSDTRVVIEVVSSQRIESSLDLHPGAATRPLLVHALRAVDPEKPRIRGVAFQPAHDGEPARLRVEVPADLPPGLYSGLLVDEETSRPMGTLSVRV